MVKPSDFRDPGEYKAVLFEMFIEYVKSDGFSSLSKEQRVRAADCVSELNMIVSEDIKT